MGSDEELLDHDLFHDDDVEVDLQLQFVLQVFVLDVDWVVLIVNFDIPGEKDQLPVIGGVQVEIEIVSR